VAIKALWRANLTEVNAGNGARPYIVWLAGPMIRYLKGARPLGGQGGVPRREPWRGVLALCTPITLVFAGYALMVFTVSLYNGA